MSIDRQLAALLGVGTRKVRGRVHHTTDTEVHIMVDGVVKVFPRNNATALKAGDTVSIVAGNIAGVVNRRGGNRTYKM